MKERPMQTGHKYTLGKFSYLQNPSLSRSVKLALGPGWAAKCDERGVWDGNCRFLRINACRNVERHLLPTKGIGSLHWQLTTISISVLHAINAEFCALCPHALCVFSFSFAAQKQSSPWISNPTIQTTKVQKGFLSPLCKIVCTF